MEFDEDYFNILERALPNSFGYINSDKAIELMDLGYIEKKPREEWRKSGYDATTLGIELYNTWLKQIREKHKHEWMTYAEYNDYSKEEYTKQELEEPYHFAYSQDTHNGFVCKNCGFHFCEHCTNEYDIEVCTSNKKKFINTNTKVEELKNYLIKNNFSISIQKVEEIFKDG